MNVLLDIMLSYRGILVLTMIVIFIVGMVYCRVVTGVGITNIFLSAPALSLPSGKSPEGGTSAVRGLKQLLGTASSVGLPAPSYEEIQLTGGSGRGTVTEVLAQQTEKKLMESSGQGSTPFPTSPQDSPFSGLEFMGGSESSGQQSDPMDDIFDGFSLGDTYET